MQLVGQTESKRNKMVLKAFVIFTNIFLIGKIFEKLFACMHVIIAIDSYAHTADL